MPRLATEIGKQRFYSCPLHPGVRYISVTTALSKSQDWAIPAASAAKATAERAYDQADEWLHLDRGDALRFLKAAHIEKRDTAASAGTLLHSVAERVISGLDLTRAIEDVELPPHLWPAAERIAAWWADAGLDVVLVERTVFHHDLAYAGTLDALVRDATGEHFILDLKTQGYPDPAKWRLQLAAYAHADHWVDDDDHFEPMPRADRGIVLWIPRDDPDAWERRFLDIGPETQQTWLNVLGAYRYLASTPSTDGKQSQKGAA